MALYAASSLRAAGTDPTLALAESDVSRTAAGVGVVTVGGTFSFDDLVQFSFPAGLLVVQGNRFVRYDFDGTLREGTDDGVADGVGASEVLGLLAAGGPPGTPAALLQVRADRIVVALPASITPGAASVLVYAVLTDGATQVPFVSNTLTIVVPSDAG
jgi:hypothetical protein